MQTKNPRSPYEGETISAKESVRLTFQVGLFVLCFFVVLLFFVLFLMWVFFGIFLFYIFWWVLKVIINMRWVMQCSYMESGSWKCDKTIPVLFC